jgi:hypothetical protein
MSSRATVMPRKSPAKPQLLHAGVDLFDTSARWRAVGKPIANLKIPHPDRKSQDSSFSEI